MLMFLKKRKPLMNQQNLLNLKFHLLLKTQQKNLNLKIQPYHL
jgi:hypothetical protein